MPRWRKMWYPEHIENHEQTIVANCKNVCFYHRQMALILSAPAYDTDATSTHVIFSRLWCVSFEYKYIWRDRNISFLKMCGRYDRACCSDNFNRKKIIIRGWELVSYCIPAFAYHCLWLQTWYNSIEFCKSETGTTRI